MRLIVASAMSLVVGLLVVTPVASADVPNSIITEPEAPDVVGDDGSGTTSCRKCVTVYYPTGRRFECTRPASGGFTGKTDCKAGPTGCSGHHSCTVREV